MCRHSQSKWTQAPPNSRGLHDFQHLSPGKRGDSETGHSSSQPMNQDQCRPYAGEVTLTGEIHNKNKQTSSLPAFSNAGKTSAVKEWKHASSEEARMACRRSAIHDTEGCLRRNADKHSCRRGDASLASSNKNSKYPAEWIRHKQEE